MAIMLLGPLLPRRSEGGDEVHPALPPNLVLLACTAATVKVRAAEHLEVWCPDAACESLIS